jgi:hypothetical protein
VTNGNTAREPEIGSLAFDTKNDRVGVVMARQGDQIYLRPLGGGKEWSVHPAQMRPATPQERLSAVNTARNTTSENQANVNSKRTLAWTHTLDVELAIP